jgi:hypothetical protein
MCQAHHGVLFTLSQYLYCVLRPRAAAPSNIASTARENLQSTLRYQTNTSTSTLLTSCHACCDAAVCQGARFWQIMMNNPYGLDTPRPQTPSGVGDKRVSCAVQLGHDMKCLLAVTVEATSCVWVASIQLDCVAGQGSV